MRSALNEGIGREDNICPVCGHLVTSLKSDAILDEEYQKIQDELYNPEFTLTFLEKILTWSELQVL